MGQNRDFHDQSPPIPIGLEDIGKEMDAIVWLQTQLSTLNRIKPCKRNDTLQAVLTERLNSTSTLPTVSEFSIQKLEIERLRKEVDELETGSWVPREIEELNEQVGNLNRELRKQQSLKFSVFLAGLVVGVVMGVVVTVIISHLLTSISH